MLSKPATMLLGLIHTEPSNAYELIKKLQYMNVKSWYDIADSTVYATIKAMEKKLYITGKTQKVGNMPDKTIYSLTEAGYAELKNTLKFFMENFDYDIVPFMIAAFFIKIFDNKETNGILNKRLKYLEKSKQGILNQIETLKSQNLPDYVICNIKHNALIVQAEITSVKEYIELINKI